MRQPGVGTTYEPARVILFGSAARGELTPDSDLDFLVIERDVENRGAEAVRLRDAVGRIGWPEARPAYLRENGEHWLRTQRSWRPAG